MDALSFLKGSHKRGEIHLATVSGVATTKKELIELFDRSIPSVDIITTKSFQTVPTPGNREPVVCSPSPGDFGNSVGLRNPGMESALKELREIRAKGMRALLCVSLAASNPEDFITLVKAFDPVADILELNFSCPHAAAGFGASIGTDKAIASEYVRAIITAYPERHAPLVVKLTPNVPDIADIAEAVIKAGADGVSAINTVGPKLYTEPHSGAPILNNKLGGKGGASGEWVKEEAIKAIRLIRERIGDDPIILGMGGVSSAEDARRMVEAGADSVGIGSAISRVHPKDWEAFFSSVKNGGDSSLYLSKENALEYTPHKIVRKENFGDDVVVFTLDGKSNAEPGEFMFIWVPGKGEKPFSVAVYDPLTFLIKKRGMFTSSLFDMREGDTLYTRGLYGSPMAYEKTRRALLIGGGTGAAVRYVVPAPPGGADRSRRGHHRRQDGAGGLRPAGGGGLHGQLHPSCGADRGLQADHRTAGAGHHPGVPSSAVRRVRTWNSHRISRTAVRCSYRGTGIRIWTASCRPVRWAR